MNRLNALAIGLTGVGATEIVQTVDLNSTVQLITTIAVAVVTLFRLLFPKKNLTTPKDN